MDKDAPIKNLYATLLKLDGLSGGAPIVEEVRQRARLGVRMVVSGGFWAGQTGLNRPRTNGARVARYDENHHPGFLHTELVVARRGPPSRVATAAAPSPDTPPPPPLPSQALAPPLWIDFF